MPGNQKYYLTSRLLTRTAAAHRPAYRPSCCANHPPLQRMLGLRRSHEPRERTNTAVNVQRSANSRRPYPNSSRKMGRRVARPFGMTRLPGLRIYPHHRPKHAPHNRARAFHTVPAKTVSLPRSLQHRAITASTTMALRGREPGDTVPIRADPRKPSTEEPFRTSKLSAIP